MRETFANEIILDAFEFPIKVSPAQFSSRLDDFDFVGCTIKQWTESGGKLINSSFQVVGFTIIEIL